MHIVYDHVFPKNVTKMVYKTLKYIMSILIIGNAQSVIEKNMNSYMKE